MILGAVLILAALLLFLHNRGEDRSAGQEAETLLEEARSVIADNSAQPDAPEEPEPEIVYDYAGVISIPAIGIDLLQVQACAVDNSQTVNGNIAGHGAQNTHLDGAAGSGRTGSGTTSRTNGDSHITPGGNKILHYKKVSRETHGLHDM